MAGIRIAKFSGTAPKVSPELLPDTVAQTARNCKLFSGDLIPYPQPVVVANTQRTGQIKTLFGLRNPDDPDDIKWLSWLTDVDISIASVNPQREQRFYYTGDGAPKVSTYALAVQGSGPYPVAAYDLGLPLPPSSATPTTTAATFTTKTTASFSRDAGSVATIVTSTPHGLRTGNNITITGFTFRSGTYAQAATTITVTLTGHGLSVGASVTLDFTSGAGSDGAFTVSTVPSADTFTVVAPNSQTTSGNVNLDLRGFNANSVECTVVNDTTFTYFSPGSAYTTVPYTTGEVTLGGLTQARSYVFTWYTPWEEESIASLPSTELFIKEGIQVTVSNLPTVPPSGNTFVRGIRLYRTIPSASGTEFFLLKTLWFPTGLSTVSRTGNVSRVSLLFPHNFGIGNRFKISGATDSSFNIVDGVVTDLIDEYTFEYAQTGANVAETTVGAGTLYHDVSENQTVDAARYWGDSSYDFLDDFDSRNLFTTLATDEYDPPPADLQGLTVLQSDILCGFVGSTVYFSEPGQPHAWPAIYSVALEHNIVGLATIGGALFVATDAYPYLIEGSDPANGFSTNRIDANYPCLNKNSLVAMGYGIVYSTHDGLAVYSFGGPQLITRALYNRDTWQADIDPTTVQAEYYGAAYLASHSTGGFVFEQDPQVGGFFVNLDYSFSASWYDSVGGVIYYVSGENGDIYRWDDLSQPFDTQEWKSKVINPAQAVNLGAARVIADYVTPTEVWDLTTTDWESTSGLWNAANGVTFRLWVDKQLEYESTLFDDRVFRLPAGYRADKFEVGVEGNVRIRAVHLAETPLGLKEV